MSRVALDLGFLQIYWYSIMIALALLVGVSIMLIEAKKQKISEDNFINLIFYGTLVGIVGARLYYVIFNWSYYSSHLIEILEIWNGGLAIHGAMITGGLFVIYYCKKVNFSILKIIDIIVVGLIIGQAIGRWGNFFNQEAYGRVVSLEFLQSLHLPEFIINGMKIGANYYHPTFLYESIWCLIGFIILLIARKFRYIHVGQITALYMIWYGLGRFMIESLRTDSLMLGNFKMAQIISILMIIIGIIIFVYKYRKSRFEDQYNLNEEVIVSVATSKSK